MGIELIIFLLILFFAFNSARCKIDNYTIIKEYKCQSQSSSLRIWNQSRWTNERNCIQKKLNDTIARRNEAEIMRDKSIGMNKIQWKKELELIDQEMDLLNVRQINLMKEIY